MAQRYPANPRAGSCCEQVCPESRDTATGFNRETQMLNVNMCIRHYSNLTRKRLIVLHGLCGALALSAYETAIALRLSIHVPLGIL